MEEESVLDGSKHNLDTLLSKLSHFTSYQSANLTLSNANLRRL